jgi:hypothetical protein
MSATPRKGKKTSPSSDGAATGGKSRKPRTRKPKDEEERLDQAIRDVLGTGPEKAKTPAHWRSLRETWRIPLLYPGKHVAFIDHYEGEGYKRLLLRREVLCVSRSRDALLKRLDKILETMPEGTEHRVGTTYVDPPDALPFLL